MAFNNVFDSVYQYGPGGGGGEEGEVPDVEDVRFGIPVGDSVGVLLLPTEAQVLLDVGYGAFGTEFTGTLRDVPGGVGSEAPPVTIEGNLRSPLIIGDDYVLAKGRAFQWTLSLWSGFDPGSATAVFRGRDVCSSEGYEWEVTGTVAADGDGYIATFEIPTAVSELITAGNYDWWVVIDDVTVQSSESFGSVEWALG